MTSRKKTIDNRVRYVNKDGLAHSEQAPHFSKEGDRKPNTRRKDASINKLLQKKKMFTNYSYEG